MINSRDNFYVYIHYRLDNMQPFYIGKGTGDRAYRKNNRSKWWLNIVNKFGYEVKIISNNLSEGAIYFNIHITNISNCCLGIRQSAGKHPETNEKLRWRKFDAE